MIPLGTWLRLGGLALVLGLVFFGGCRAQAAHEASARTRLEAKVREKDAALDAAALALRGSASALRRQNAENAAALQEADERRAIADEAGKIAAGKAASATKQLEALRAQRERAKQSIPCRQLLETDVVKVCGALK